VGGEQSADRFMAGAMRRRTKKKKKEKLPRHSLCQEQGTILLEEFLFLRFPKAERFLVSPRGKRMTQEEY
jgi:hypothetical protein